MKFVKFTFLAFLIYIPIALASFNPVSAPYIEVKEKTVQDIINEKAVEYNVSAKLISDIVFCESSFNVNALGDGGHSRGLVQIYDSYHPNITHEQAYDPEFAIDFLASNLAKGKGNLWSCYRIVKSR